MELTPRVIAAIDKYFAEGERAAVAELLLSYGERTEPERIHVLILKMSRRDINRVRILVEAAKQDYRDVIMWASHSSRTYIVGLLRNSPNAFTDSQSTLELASLERWKKADAIVIGGLCLEDSQLRGLYIFTVDSIEAAQALADTDPAIQSGKLIFEFHRWMSADGLQVGVPKDFLDV